ncbi:MAG: NAD(P)/FAD-dependent oxidoreductase [Candidatus Omnitrophica bacterium]|nr:NAD(P)/FAD-dependent oxidoreductase [Candidatus Omnitrophota bacterium]MCM8827230.1 NAD(P)/FAD-dependent oxidoreductase [Candidatus Omnitrophota bacterium]
MREICIIGGGEGGISLIKQLRILDKEVKIRLIEKEDYYFRRRDLFKWWAGLGKMEIFKLKEFAQTLNFDFVKAEVERINFNRRKIYLKEMESIDFDILVICSGVKSKDLSIKGDFREGFFYLSEVKPIVIRDYLKLFTDILIYCSTILGIKLAFYFSYLKKDIKFVAKNLDFLSQYKDIIFNKLSERKIDIYLNSTIEEVIGEATVKATRISLPKVFSSQLVFVDSGFIPNRDYLETNLVTNNFFFTNYLGVYLLGDVNNPYIEKEYFFAFNTDNVEKQAQLLANHLVRNEVIDYQLPLLANDNYLEEFLKSLN